MSRPLLSLAVGCSITLVASAMSSRAPATATAWADDLTFPATLPSDGAGDATTQASADNEAAARRKRTAELEQFYADTYGRAAGEKNRLTRLVGLMSLARIDGEPLSAKLLALVADPDLLVGQLAWEALHARHASLTPAQRTAWISGGLDLAKRGAFPGSTAASLVRAATLVPAAQLRELAPLLVRVADENDPAMPEGKATIDAAADAIATWRDARVVQTLIARMGAKPAVAQRIATMLGKLDGAPAPTTDLAQLRGTWGRFSREAKLAGPTTMPAYAGASPLVVAPAAITDPDDERWRRELELDDLKLDAVDLAFCVDATQSMEKNNEFVAAYAETATRLLRLMSSQVRAGTVYYRHEIDPAIQDKCCKTVGERKADWFVQSLPLMPDTTALVQQMRAQRATGRFSGHDGNGAYAAGIATAMTGMPWAPKGKRIIACTGDAKITPGSDRAMVELARKARDEGYLLLFLARDPNAARSVSAASRAATGLEPIVFKADAERLADLAADAGGDDRGSTSAAIARFRGSAFEQMTVVILEQALPADYRNRVRPLVDAVLPILQAQEAVAQLSRPAAPPRPVVQAPPAAVKPATPPKGGGGIRANTPPKSKGTTPQRATP